MSEPMVTFKDEFVESKIIDQALKIKIRDALQVSMNLLTEYLDDMNATSLNVAIRVARDEDGKAYKGASIEVKRIEKDSFFVGEK